MRLRGYSEAYPTSDSLLGSVSWRARSRFKTYLVCRLRVCASSPSKPNRVVAKMEAGMKAACEKFNFAGANVFSGEPLTATKGPWFVKDAAFQVNPTAYALSCSSLSAHFRM